MNRKLPRWTYQVAALAVLFGCGWIAAGAADRIFTNPRPEAHLKQLFSGRGGLSFR